MADKTNEDLLKELEAIKDIAKSQDNSLNEIQNIIASIEGFGKSIQDILKNILLEISKGFKDITTNLTKDFAEINTSIQNMNDSILESLETLDEDLILFGEGTPAASAAEDLLLIGELKTLLQDIWGIIKDVYGIFRKLYNVIVNKLIIGTGKWFAGQAKSAIEFGRSLSKLNASLASTFAISDFKKVLRDIKYGNLTSESTGNLVRAVDDLKDAIVPTEAAIINIFNVVATGIIRAILFIRNTVVGLVDLVLEFLPFLKPIKDFLEAIKKWLFGENNQKIFPIQQFINDAANGDFSRHREPMFVRP